MCFAIFIIYIAEIVIMKEKMKKMRYMYMQSKNFYFNKL